MKIKELLKRCVSSRSSKFLRALPGALAMMGCLVVAAPARGQTTLFTFNGDSVSDGFGFPVSGAGDVNGDGFDDIIVGAPGDDNNGTSSGSARVLSGLDGSILYTFNGDSAGDSFGEVSGAGDVNGDGFADFIVGAGRNDNNGTNSGSARVFSGLDGSVLYTFNGDSSQDRLGGRVSGAGDVNGDGSGSARVFSGLDGSILYTFNGDSAGDSFGQSVSGAGDVNGDGFADLIVGAPSDQPNGNKSGSARVFSGLDGSILYTFNGDSNGDNFGFSVSGAGDLNGDGFDDIIVGAPGDDPGGGLCPCSGSAQVFSGLDGSILYIFNGDSALDNFGHSVSGAGDVNGDGFSDLIVGAVFDDNNGTDSGSARVFSGLDGSILFTSVGDSADDKFGQSVSGAGDVNGDGFADIIVGTQFDDNNGSNSGSARVISYIVSVDTPIGSVAVEPVDSRTGEAVATITYDNVTEAGTTGVISTVLTPGQEAPAGFMLGDPPVVFNVFTTATFDGNVEVCFDYTSFNFANEADLQLFHSTDGVNWVLLDTTNNTGTDVICGSTTSFSLFGLFELIRDTDGDGLSDGEEVNIYGTDMFLPDTDGDGLLDSTEVELAASGGCHDPLNPDTDGDGLLDGDEVALGTDPCNVDSDGDGILDTIDGSPLDPDGNANPSDLEAATRNVATLIEGLPLVLFNGPNENATAARRNSLSTRTRNAANEIADEDFDSARSLLTNVLSRIDGDSPPPDWMINSTDKTLVAELVDLLISLLP